MNVEDLADLQAMIEDVDQQIDTFICSHLTAQRLGARLTTPRRRGGVWLEPRRLPHPETPRGRRTWCDGCDGKGWVPDYETERDCCDTCEGFGFTCPTAAELRLKRGRARAHRRRLVGDARRVRERARRNVLRHLGRIFLVRTDLRYTEARGSLPLGARVFLLPRGVRGEAFRETWMETVDAWPHEGLLGGAWRCDGSAVYGGREHLRHDRREHRREVDACFEARDLDPEEMPF